MKNSLSVLLSVLLSFTSAFSAAAESSGNNQLTLYSDGSCEAVSSCADADVKSGRAILVQPNYVYTAAAVSVNDTYFTEQWALQNDGTFQTPSGANGHPVYDDPFGRPRGGWSHIPESIPGIPGGPSGLGGGFRPFAGKYYELSQTVSGIDINMEQAWQLYNGGSRSVVVALIDTGVDTGHEDFNADVFWTNEDEIPGNGLDDDQNGYVDDVNGWNFYANNNRIYTGSEDDHGTHGAGSIVASTNNSIGISGIVSDGSVKIMTLKALGGSEGAGTTDAMIKAIRYAEANGASICSLSCGTDSYDPALYRTMADSDMLFVVAAGNDSVDTDREPSYPAAFDLDNIISVANLQPDGTLHESSNYGASSVDLAVPGTYILSLTANNSYSYMTGTSMSAPICAAVAAMVYADYETLSLSQVREVLLDSAQGLNGLRGFVSTGGMLDAGVSLALAKRLAASTINIPFYDIPSEGSLHDAVSVLYRLGVMVGTSESAFSPDNTLTRAMTVTILGRLGRAVISESNSFIDVEPNSWYSGYVGWAVQNGIVYGYGNQLFGTNDPVTRVQLGLMLTRYARSLGLDYESPLIGNEPLTRGETAVILYEFAQLSDLYP